VKFWDTSAVVPLLLPETRSAACARLLASDRTMMIWALTPVEALSAIYRRQREGGLSAVRLHSAQTRLKALRGAWSEVRDVDLVGVRAERLLALHPIRAADALQLAAALLVSNERPGELPFVCLDINLGAAATREGFLVLP